MRKINRIITVLGTLLPSIALAHEAPQHVVQSVFAQMLDLEHIMLFGIPTLIVAVIAYRQKNNLKSLFTKQR